ncbi:hypothetical protein [Bacillus sp. 1P02SD]|uniref:YfjL-like protein n=1 Tax=Bacillus sp. 1P02SD TaxID=3132264 RepID=UPI00399F649D
MKKIIILVVLLLIVAFVFYLYASFYGLPWKKTQVSNELKQYVEEKYDIEVAIEESYFNFKFDHYGTIFKLRDDKEFSFSAEKRRDNAIHDYYPEAVWEKEVKEDLTPLIDSSFDSLSVDRYGVYPVYGIGNLEDIQKDVPSYKDVQTGINSVIHFKEEHSSKTEEALIKEIFSFIQKVNEKGIRNIELTFDLKEQEEEKPKTFYITIPSDKLYTIKTEDDVKKYIKEF